MIFGKTFGRLALDVESDIVIPATGSLGFAIMGHIVARLNSRWAFTVRPEYLSKVGGFNSNFQLTTGPQFSPTDGFTAKADYTLSRPASVTNHAVNIAGVFSF